MERFFDYPASLWAYFHDVDRRFTESGNISPKPCPVDTYGDNLGNVRAVLWDVYGTLCGVGLGDLEKSLQDLQRLQIAAQATINEFSLEPALTQLYPQQSPAQALRDRYLQLIDESHQRSLLAGVEYPEVVIENIWENILHDCCRAGYQPPCPEESIYTAYRWAYFFDVSIQKTYFYPGIMECLLALKQAGIVQGIISNAQFYTPLHLRRLFRIAQKQDNFALEDIFTDTLVFFSYELGCSKPNPKAFIQALDVLDTMGFAPRDILYIGNDMLNDIWTAAQYKLRTALFAADSTQTNLRPDAPCCAQLKPDAIVTDPASIPQLILTNQ
jgi:putative hydrolase of the HAD superfamily